MMTIQKELRDISPSLESHRLITEPEEIFEIWQKGFEASAQELFGYTANDLYQEAIVREHHPSYWKVTNFISQGLASNIIANEEAKSFLPLYPTFESKLFLFRQLPDGEFKSELADSLLGTLHSDPYPDHVTQLHWAIYQEITPDISRAIDRVHTDILADHFKSVSLGIETIVYLLDNTKGTNSHAQAIELAQEFFRKRPVILQEWKEFIDTISSVFPYLPDILANPHEFISQVEAYMESRPTPPDDDIRMNTLHTNIYSGLFGYHVKMGNIDKAYDAAQNTPYFWGVSVGLQRNMMELSLHANEEPNKRTWDMVWRVVNDFPVTKGITSAKFFQKSIISGWLNSMNQAYTNGVAIDQWDIPIRFQQNLDGFALDEQWHLNIESSQHNSTAWNVLFPRIQQTLEKAQQGDRTDQMLPLAYGIMTLQRLQQH